MSCIVYYPEIAGGKVGVNLNTERKKETLELQILYPPHTLFSGNITNIHKIKPAKKNIYRKLKTNLRTNQYPTKG